MTSARTIHPFTLLEILIAIGIIIILAGITVGGLNYASGRSDEARNQTILKEFEMALEKYKSDHGMYPVWKNTSDVKRGIRLNENHWKKFTAGSYFQAKRTDFIEDAYGNPLFYRYPGKENESGYDLWSAGSDGKHGNDDKACTHANADVNKAGATGTDDVCNWRSQQ